jgi:hypothetical protein
MLTLITDGCWTEPLADSWERRKRRAPCATCRRSTRGVYLVEGVETEPMCAQCAVRYAHDGPRAVKGGAA